MYFSETQRFRQPWIWILLVLVAGAGIASGVHYFRSAHKGSEQTVAAWIGMLVPFVLICFFLAIKLEANIDAEGVDYRFFPIHGRKRKLLWDEIAEAYVRQYSPLREYGGWGMRNSLGKAGMAFNIRGNMGIQLVLKNGKKILLGTQKPDEAAIVLQQLGKAKI